MMNPKLHKGNFNEVRMNCKLCEKEIIADSANRRYCYKCNTIIRNARSLKIKKAKNEK